MNCYPDKLFLQKKNKKKVKKMRKKFVFYKRIFTFAT